LESNRSKPGTVEAANFGRAGAGRRENDSDAGSPIQEWPGISLLIVHHGGKRRRQRRTSRRRCAQARFAVLISIDKGEAADTITSRPASL
jgi:hypothetical protein